MHLLIPFAAPLAAAGRQALPTLVLPHLRALLGCLREVERDVGDEWSLSTPHERALARSLGLSGGDGQLPWAAWLAGLEGLDTADLAWGLVTPTHWHLGTEQVSLLDPSVLQLEPHEAAELFDAVHELFASDGFVLLRGASGRWYTAHECLRGLATASLDRVIGRNVDPWLGDDPAARRVRRLQGEVQMLLHTHPINARREARGLLSVNSFWISGCGAAQPMLAPAPRVDDRLRAPCLAEDWEGWRQAWASLDREALADLMARWREGQQVRLTLCGERSYVGVAGRRTLGAWLRAWGPAPVAFKTLEML